MSKTLLVMAGGTGGHVFPGLAVADRLKAQGWTIHWLGTADRMEAELVPAHGYPISFIDIQGVRGNGLKRLLEAPYRIVKSILQARQVLKTIRPDVVLGMGGFASGPGGVAAWLSGIPLLLHEQNASAGMTNKLLARIAKRVLMAFPGAFAPSRRTAVVGNPVRPEVVALPAPDERMGGGERPLRLLIIGGSLGARVLNEQVPLAVAAAGIPVEVRHQTGKGNQEAVAMAYGKLGLEAEVSDFIKEMAGAYAWADLVVCRAGALTVSEVAAAGVAAIFVPLPHAVDDHQTRNALTLVDGGAAEFLPQSDLTPASLAARLVWLAGRRDTLLKMAQAARRIAITDAAERVADECKRLAE
ncbi:undecaprenyldiphospho-muramoylpentapeptide beta-N-acetylglucosaminyltransferase [Aeromonas schubertii]|uniref:UDP-N-acetylglucosamine--N-acetylmuramyl-(pentapeptide) pyrophosphoryl-undecaprenol N-acetylglucosamine transferase n=1 Tax=Aeromonas schubertii TaxID=652 RepID=A0A0S2SGQ4_9GAMM|nr:undecaprenyldiphospho-muramoylpentapeptide beta-N-acetylglucosaminyltransferase [Aeromonas schubertii]ALP40900.1 undecaprenyldiphospho-muramoylpentapeptide beta-N- acetylglucosaminyltransferase [Aeromonas schubertii]KUE79539.1 UDP-N-acetylglucosamine--N-acetylmuramyl-(pentapeptide) pyrophosphoryl-undecaprenol N-acetylglucosamine transferase [Aeromonas schubertii]MBZ6065435.1 undecaprenyldiphospho-muramoylpentapeptide beta-N-acetylglucosaminyltransferase [Aeromonas schubertii]MBZ6072307.1 und